MPGEEIKMRAIRLGFPSRFPCMLEFSGWCSMAEKKTKCSGSVRSAVLVFVGLFQTIGFK